MNAALPILAADMLLRLRPREVFYAGGTDPALIDRLFAALPADGMLHLAGTALAIQDKTARDIGERVMLHRAAPWLAVPLVPPCDLVLIDDDPNFHTVHMVLREVAAQAARHGRRFPVVLVANAGWPYARRDGYQDPNALPESARHSHARAGLRPGAAAPSGGLFATMYNALEEGHPRQGVLTAVEVFQAECGLALCRAVVPALHGVCALAPDDAEGRAALAGVAMGVAAREAAEAAEAARVSGLCEAMDLEQAAVAAVHEAGLLRASAAPVGAAGAAAAAADAGRGGLRGLLGRLRGQAAPADAGREREIELIRTSELFDVTWYQFNNPDVAEVGRDPIEHYLEHGWREGRDPSPIFSTAAYLQANPDVAEAGVNPLVHYLRDGKAEGRRLRA